MREEIKQYFYGATDETWEGALARLKTFCHLDLDEFEDEETGKVERINLGEVYDSGALFSVERKEPAERMAFYEQEYKINIPAELKALMCHYGSFALKAVSCRYDPFVIITGWGGHTLLELYSSSNPIFPNIKTFQDAMFFNWGPDHPIITELEPEALVFLNQNCFFFGYFSIHDQAKQYFYFDPEGNFGAFYFDDEDVASTMADSVQPILDGTAEKMTLDRLISRQVDAAIQAILEALDISID